MYAFVYIWRIAVNIFNIIVVLYVFSKLDTRDERLYVSILGLLYVTIRSIGFGLATGVLPGLIAVGRQAHRDRGHRPDDCLAHLPLRPVQRPEPTRLLR